MFRNMVAVLAGAGRVNGVGAATARMLAKNGCNIMLGCLNNSTQAEAVLKQCSELGVETELFVGDLTIEKNCYEMADLAQEKWGKTNFLVNCIGATKPINYESLDLLSGAEFNKILTTNLTAPFMISKAFKNLLVKSSATEHSSCIVNISSAAGISGVGSSIAYSSAKGGLNTLTLSLAKALSPEVRVNAVCPSFINSSWWDDIYAERQEQYSKLMSSICNGNLLNKVLSPDDVAKTVLSIIDNQCMTGEFIRLDAGAHIGKANDRKERPTYKP